jgi:hypothetical protein
MASLENEIGHGNTGLTPWSALGDVEENVPELIGLNAITTFDSARPRSACFATLRRTVQLTVATSARWADANRG